MLFVVLILYVCIYNDVHTNLKLIQILFKLKMWGYVTFKNLKHMHLEILKKNNNTTESVYQ